MKLLAINRKTEIEESKLYGEVYLPDEWLEKDIFSPFEFFLAQINLSEIKSELLDCEGYLYFFIEAYNFSQTKLKAKVRYFAGEPDAYTDFNDGYFETDLNEYALIQESIGTLNYMEVVNEQVVLLEIPTELLPFASTCKKIQFVVELNELKVRNFDNIRLVFVN